MQHGEPFTVAVLPDTQYYVRNYPEVLTRQAEWLAMNAASRNIAFVLHVGDITDNNTPEQWERAREGIGVLNGVVPYVLAVGNHDIADGTVKSREDTLIDRYFPAEGFPSLQGTYEPGKIANSYHTFTVGDRKYMAMALEFGPRDGVLAWANQVVAAHPDHTVLVVTHTYTSGSGSRVTPGTSGGSPELVLPPEVRDVNNGEDMWTKFIRKHPNILMVVSGHIGATAIPWNIGIGDMGNRVFEFLNDYQGEPYGGHGWLVLYEFQTDGKIEVKVYSPYLDEFKTDIDKYRNGNQMTADPERGWVTVH